MNNVMRLCLAGALMLCVVGHASAAKPAEDMTPQEREQFKAEFLQLHKDAAESSQQIRDSRKRGESVPRATYDRHSEMRQRYRAMLPTYTQIGIIERAERANQTSQPTQPKPATPATPTNHQDASKPANPVGPPLTDPAAVRAAAIRKAQQRAAAQAESNEANKPRGAAGALSNAKQLVAAEAELNEAMKQDGVAAIDRNDKATRTQTKKRYQDARSAWDKLRRERPTVDLAAMLAACPPESRGAWAEFGDWSLTQKRAFETWAQGCEQVRVEIEGTITSAKTIGHTAARVQAVQWVTIQGKQFEIPVSIIASSTRASQISNAKPGDLIKGQFIVTNCGVQRRPTGENQLHVSARLDYAEVFRPEPGQAQPQRVWPDMTAVADRMEYLRDSLRSKNLKGDRLFAQARKDAKYRDKAVQAYTSYEWSQIRLDDEWHPYVTAAQWLAGCPEDTHGPWDAPEQWTTAQSRAFDRWLASSEGVKLLAQATITDPGEYKSMREGTPAQLRINLDMADLPVTVNVAARRMRSTELTKGQSLHTSMVLRKGSKWTIQNGRVVLQLDAKLLHATEQPLDENGKPPRG